MFTALVHDVVTQHIKSIWCINTWLPASITKRSEYCLWLSLYIHRVTCQINKTLIELAFLLSYSDYYIQTQHKEVKYLKIKLCKCHRWDSSKHEIILWYAHNVFYMVQKQIKERKCDNTVFHFDRFWRGQQFEFCNSEAVDSWEPSSRHYSFNLYDIAALLFFSTSFVRPNRFYYFNIIQKLIITDLSHHVL